MEAKPQSPDDTLNHLRPVSMPHVETLPLFNLAASAYSWQAIVALKSYLLCFDSMFCNKCGHKWHLACIIVIISVLYVCILIMFNVWLELLPGKCMQYLTAHPAAQNESGYACSSLLHKHDSKVFLIKGALTTQDRRGHLKAAKFCQCCSQINESYRHMDYRDYTSLLE